MKRKMLTICLTVFLLPLAIGYSNETTEEMSVAEKAFRLRMEGKSQQAKEMLSGYLVGCPDDAVAQFEYSRVLFYLFDIKAAGEHAALAIQRDSDNPTYHCWRGMCATYLYIDQAHHKGNLDASIIQRAITSFQKAIELKPDYHHARFLLVNLLNNNPPEQGGDKKQAHQHADYLMEADLDYGLQVLMIMEGEKSLDWKLEEYQSALAKEPNNAGLHAKMALLYVESDNLEELQEHIDKAIELDEQQKDILLDTAFQLAMKKKLQTAHEMVQRYLDLAKDEPAAMRAFALFYLAKIKEMSGDANADHTLKQSRQVDPDVWMTMKAPPAMLFEPLSGAQ